MLVYWSHRSLAKVGMWLVIRGKRCKGGLPLANDRTWMSETRSAHLDYWSKDPIVAARRYSIVFGLPARRTFEMHMYGIGVQPYCHRRNNIAQ